MTDISTKLSALLLLQAKVGGPSFCANLFLQSYFLNIGPISANDGSFFKSERFLNKGERSLYRYMTLQV